MCLISDKNLPKINSKEKLPFECTCFRTYETSGKKKFSKRNLKGNAM